MIIGTRDLFIISDHRRQAVQINIYQPQLRSGSWYCPYSIGWPGQPDTGETGGADGIQAIFNTLQMIAIRLYSSNYHANGSLVWDTPGNGYGFPIPKSSRDLLVGSDKRFYG